jgi:hypothetical protein
MEMPVPTNNRLLKKPVKARFKRIYISFTIDRKGAVTRMRTFG